jgi:hypothetical protein
MTDNINLESAFIFAGGIYLVSAMAVVLPWVKLKPSKT